MSGKKAVLITGAAGGIGACIAETLAGEGYNIIITDIVSEDKAEAAVNSCANRGAEVLFVQSDVSSYESCEEAVNKSVEKFGGIYALVNNAGIIRDSLLMRMSEQQFDSVININLKSVFNMSKHVVTHMVKAKEGRIVNISSVAGIYGNAGQTNYSSSKAGIIGFTKSLAKEVGSRSITVNAVAPGYIATNMTASLPEGAAEAIMSRISLKTLGAPKDVANAVSFLISEKASYISGHVLSVDGGMSL
ncbi:MAG: 3-oxoacyl-[acyl-carrier-protein] reductase [Oscillospiraceae bacterium]|nr:3-oxoacyl-[acyl-carrier-protein] reductase [Oscillospiraceae bacterium]